ncbi:MAG: AMP-binding protein [Aquincola sp.]|nr:AMP-binding protein [Aquincola sp.]MDH4287505.1 AMP-binding protein [Aquincola sp.]
MIRTDAYRLLHAGFRWQVPQAFNWFEACCARWARHTPDAPALVCETESGDVATHRYADLHEAALRAAAALAALGVSRGDRVAIVMPQRFETAVAHMAVSALGGVAMPLSMLFGPEALQYRLVDSSAKVAIVDESAIDALLAAAGQCPALAHVVAVGGAAGRGSIDWWRALRTTHPAVTPTATLADDPACLIYTSGTTGPPKGALIPQRALIGNLTGFVCSQNWFPHIEPPCLGKGGRGGVDSPEGSQNVRSMFWSPADWAWTGGLMDALLPTLCFGRPILGFNGRFAPERAFELMLRHGVTHTFLFPTALKAMMKSVPEGRARFPGLELAAIMSAGEMVGDAVFAYGRAALGVTVNEMFGQTEINYIVGNCGRFLGADGRWHDGWPARPGSMGRPYPGHRIAVIDDDGRELPRGEAGDVAMHRRDIHGHPDPVFFLGYWQRDEATRAKFTGDPDDSWCRTGDTAVMDAAGYLWYQGRSDDMFKAAGYRIGPSEVENCLVKHPAVANAAVVPKPDAERGAVVKAYVVLAPGHVGDAALVEQLQRHVRGRLAPYEYPKEIEFIEALPMTTTGKVQRRVLRLQEEERAGAPKP